MSEGGNHEDACIIARAKVRDPDAIAVLYDRYATSLYRVAYGLMRSRADAEDVVHDVFVGLPTALKTFEHRGSFVGWLKRVTSRVALMKLRAQRLAREVTLGKLEGVLSNPREVSALDRLSLEDAIGGLPPKLRTVFVLKEVEGFPHDEIASMLGIGVAASKVRLHRARRRLRERLEGPT